MTFLCYHLTPYLKPSQGDQKTCKLPKTTWNKMHTSCPGHQPCLVALHLSGPPPLFLSQSFHCTSSSNSLSTCCPGLAQAAASAWLCSWLAPSHSSGLNSNRVSDKYERALPVILYHSSLLIFFGGLPTLCRYFTIYCIFCLFVLFFSGRLFKEDREHVYLSP